VALKSPARIRVVRPLVAAGEGGELGAPFGGLDAAYRCHNVHRRQLDLGCPRNIDPEDRLKVVGVGVGRALLQWVAGRDPGACGARVRLEDAVRQERSQASRVQRRDGIGSEFLQAEDVDPVGAHQVHYGGRIRPPVIQVGAGDD
jgi:hypothetical protein